MSAVLRDWATIEPLLDELLALPPQLRSERLKCLPPPHQRLRPALEQLLRSAAEAEAAEFLERAASLPAAAPAIERQTDQRIGPWLLVRELGRGGMASVWLARPAEGEFQREVALKLPHNTHSPQLVERFRRERDVLARLNHPGIARLFDAGIAPDGTPWLAMERVDGQDLLSWSTARRASVRQELTLLLQIGEALQYAHGRLVIHRDIKPANVLVQADGQIRLLDFGIARLLDNPHGAEATVLTQQGQRPMTPEYASPEQVRGEEPGVASDVYSLGVLAYRLLSGVSPYATAAAPHRPALEQAILEHEPPPPSQQASDPARRRAVRGDLDTIVLKALSKAASQRYATVDALTEDLRRHLDGRPVLARPPSWRYAAQRFVRRHRLGVAASALAVVGLLATTAWALVSSREAHREARRAEAMYQFTVGLFNPDHARFANIRQADLPLRTVVERGASRVLDELQEEPEARLRLMEDLVPLSDHLGLTELSARLSRTRIAEALRLHGPRSLAYADALQGDLLVLGSQGHFAQAYEQAKAALVLYEALGITDPARLGAVHEAIGASGFRIHSPSTEDAAHLERSIALFKQMKDPGTLAQTYLQLSFMRSYLGDVAGAYAAGASGLEVYRRQFGTESWQAAQAESVLGVFAELAQRPAEAEALHRHALETVRKTIGADTVGVARSEIGLASVLFGGTGREEARQLAADALRIVHLPQNAEFVGMRDQVQVMALGLAVRDGDGAAVLHGCQPYGTQMKASTPYFSTLLAQACTAGAQQAGDQALAGKWLDASKPSYQYFAHAPSWTMGLELRRGELALAQGHTDEALRLWRHALSAATTSQLPTQVRAWSMIARHGRLNATERGRLRALRETLEREGGARYYAEFLTQLDEAERFAQ